MSGRYFIFRSVTALKWETEKDGRRTGTIKVQHYKDAAHIEPLGEPEYFRGTVPAADDETPEAVHRHVHDREQCGLCVSSRRQHDERGV